MIIYQGNTYKLPFKLTINGQTITAEDVKKVEFSIGELRKAGTFENGYAVFELTQEDTFSLLPQDSTYQIRVCFNDGSVKNTGDIQVTVKESKSKDVLQ